MRPPDARRMAIDLRPQVLNPIGDGEIPRFPIEAKAPGIPKTKGPDLRPDTFPLAKKGVIGTDGVSLKGGEILDPVSGIAGPSPMLEAQGTGSRRGRRGRGRRCGWYRAGERRGSVPRRQPGQQGDRLPPYSGPPPTDPWTPCSSRKPRFLGKAGVEGGAQKALLQVVMCGRHPRRRRFAGILSGSKDAAISLHEEKAAWIPGIGEEEQGLMQPDPDPSR